MSNKSSISRIMALALTLSLTGAITADTVLAGDRSSLERQLRNLRKQINSLKNEVAFKIPGPMGPLGPQGPIGPEGPLGPQGLQGVAGPPGLPGANGLNGAAGATGPVGATGPQGAQGPQGVQGPVGPMGPSGIAGSYEVVMDGGSVITYYPNRHAWGAANQGPIGCTLGTIDYRVAEYRCYVNGQVGDGYCNLHYCVRP